MIEPYNGFQVRCDGCGELLAWEGLDWLVFPTEAEAREHVGNSDWVFDADGKAECDTCWEQLAGRERSSDDH